MKHYFYLIFQPPFQIYLYQDQLYKYFISIAHFNLKHLLIHLLKDLLPLENVTILLKHQCLNEKQCITIYFKHKQFQKNLFQVFKNAPTVLTRFHWSSISKILIRNFFYIVYGYKMIFISSR